MHYLNLVISEEETRVDNTIKGNVSSACKTSSGTKNRDSGKRLLKHLLLHLTRRASLFGNLIAISNLSRSENMNLNELLSVTNFSTQMTYLVAFS